MVVVVDWLLVAVVPVAMEDWMVLVAVVPVVMVDWMVLVAAVPVGLVVRSTVVVGAVPMEMLLVVVD